MLNMKGLYLLSFFLFQTTFTSTFRSAETCFPKTDRRIPVFEGLRSDEVKTGLSEEEFMKVLEEAEQIFTPVFEAEGKIFVVNKLWDNAQINASAQQMGTSWIINMYGGLARHEHATLDSFRAVVCHEIGHHLGGAPRKSSWWGSTSWASNEGQSDYYATYQCMKKLILEGQAAGLEIASPDLSIYAEEEVTLVEERCSAIFQKIPDPNDPDSNTHFDSRDPNSGVSNEKMDKDFVACKRAALAGLSLGRLLGSLGSEKKISLSTPDNSQVSSTDHNHPDAQCRADTYLAGSLCDLDHNSELDGTDPNVGTCNRSENFDYGLRPRCWFKPENS